MSESTEISPLLATEGLPSDAEASSGVTSERIPAKAYFKRHIRIVTWTALAASVTTLVLSIAAFIFLQTGPFTKHDWRLEQILNFLAALVSLLIPITEIRTRT